MRTTIEMPGRRGRSKKEPVVVIAADTCYSLPYDPDADETARPDADDWSHYSAKTIVDYSRRLGLATSGECGNLA